MNSGELALSAGVLSTLVLEGIKWVVRMAMGNQDYDFPMSFYAIMLPVLNALMPFAMVFLGLPTSDPVLTMTWQGVLQYVAVTALGAVASLVAYNGGIKPLKEYNRLREVNQQLAEINRLTKG